MERLGACRAIKRPGESWLKSRVRARRKAAGDTAAEEERRGLPETPRFWTETDL